MARDFWIQHPDHQRVSFSTNVRQRSLESSEFTRRRGDILDSAVRVDMTCRSCAHPCTPATHSRSTKPR